MTQNHLAGAILSLAVVFSGLSGALAQDQIPTKEGVPMGGDLRKAPARCPSQ